MINLIIKFCKNLKHRKIFIKSGINIFDLNVIDIKKTDFHKLIDEFDQQREKQEDFLNMFLIKNHQLNKEAYFLNYELKENYLDFDNRVHAENDYYELEKNFDIIYLVHIFFTFLKSSRDFNELNFSQYFKHQFLNISPETQFFKYKFADIDSQKNQSLLFQEFYNNINEFNDPLSYQFSNTKLTGNWYYMKLIHTQLKNLILLLSKLNTEKIKGKENNFSNFSNLAKGMNYENECKDLLELNGWNVSFTPISNDHGADLIAKKGIIKIVIQCKNYHGNVGNSAIQEIYSAKAYYDADKALVVSENGFTSAAKDLANNLSVHLIENKHNLVNI